MMSIFSPRTLKLIVGSSLERSSVRSAAAFTCPSSNFRVRRSSITASIPMSSSSNTDPFSLSGKTALVTGSSGGIGKGIAKTFAEAGADVIVHYNTRREGAISTFKEINDKYAAASVELGKTNGSDVKSPGKCLGIIQADFRDPKAVDAMFQFVTNEILKDNRLDVLVNNAGIVTKLAVEDDDDLSAWHETMAVNLHAPLQLMKLAHAHMKSATPQGGDASDDKERGGGVIINNTSIHGSRSVEYMTAYAASKAALDSLTRGLACEYAPDGVRVNAIAPGVVPVERTAEALSNPGATEMWTPHLPLGRLGNVEDVARATLTLATNEWMSGTVLTVDGGMMARANMPIRPRPPKPESMAGGNATEGGEGELASSGVSFEVPT
mmetsp:Transcript_16685/g.36194  ORF Transcript_16685/g.36194 Transcript_16685/m.36194 type:complete len:381 (+) Transcript_16685:19-1161(+)